MGEVRFVHKVFWLSYPTPRDALFVRHVELLPAQGKHRDLAGFLGMPGRGEDRASSLGEMSREGQADPAVGASDERLDWVSLRRHGVRWGGRNFRTFHDLLLRG